MGEPAPGPYIAKGFALLFSGALGGTAAGVIEQASPARTHDGFFLNASVGLGKVWMRGGYGDVDISGGATALDLSAGYEIARDLVLFAAFTEVYAPSPSYTQAYLADLELHGLGPGVRYYLPFNVFFDGAVLISRLGYHNTFPADGRYGLNQTSDLRPVGRAAIGWEGWVAANWGLGVAAEGLFGWLPPHQGPGNNDPVPSYKLKGLSLLVSASFN
jgi:hypothetical protein